MEVGLAQADDPAIMEHALRNGMVCVTLDHDLHSHLAKPRQAVLPWCSSHCRQEASQQAELLIS